MLSRLIDFIKPLELDTIEQTQKAKFLHIALLVSIGTCIFLGIQNMAGDSGLDIFLFIVGGIGFLCIPGNK